MGYPGTVIPPLTDDFFDESCAAETILLELENNGARNDPELETLGSSRFAKGDSSTEHGLDEFEQ